MTGFDPGSERRVRARRRRSAGITVLGRGSARLSCKGTRISTPSLFPGPTHFGGLGPPLAVRPYSFAGCAAPSRVRRFSNTLFNADSRPMARAPESTAASPRLEGVDVDAPYGLSKVTMTR